MAGYCGYSMSNNAVIAYYNGEKPLSKWKKSDIIDIINEKVEDGSLNPNFTLNNIYKLPLSELKQFLVPTCWHHTSNRYNETLFYSLDDEKLEDLTDEKIAKILHDYKQAKASKSQNFPIKYGYAEVEIWTRSAYHPKKIGIEKIVGIVIGNWIYFKPNNNPDSITKKYMLSAHKTQLYELYSTYDELVTKHQDYRCTNFIFKRLIKEKET